MLWIRLALLLPAMVLPMAEVAMSGDATLVHDRAFVVVQDSDTSVSTLNKLDLMTGELIAVGDIGFQVTALAFSNTGELYGVDPELDVLVQIDPSQGVGAAVGPLRIDIVDPPGSDLTFDGENNPWMMATVGGARSLYRIDLHSGNAEWFALIEAPYARALAAPSLRPHTPGRWPPTVRGSTQQTTSWGSSTRPTGRWNRLGMMACLCFSLNG